MIRAIDSSYQKARGQEGRRAGNYQKIGGYEDKKVSYLRKNLLTYLPTNLLTFKQPNSRTSAIFYNNTCLLPAGNRNYTIVDQNKVDYFISQKEASLPYLEDILAHSNNEAQIVETLHIINSMLDEGVKGVDKMYPVLSRFNNTNSPNIQTYLAGIYRKTQVPDAFGPLIAMLIRNSLHPANSNFDPNEEIGGAILEYVLKSR